MRLSNVGKLVVAAVVGLPLSLVVACSNDVTVTTGPTPVQACPGSLTVASGASCFDPAVTCDYPLMCPGGFDQQVRCPCDGKTFNCVYRGEAVAKGATPECKPGLGQNGENCLASVQASEGKACTSVGQLCFFTGLKCADGSQNTDTCQCAPGDGGYRYACSRKLCPGDGGVVPPPPQDAGGADAADGG